MCDAIDGTEIATWLSRAPMTVTDLNDKKDKNNRINAEHEVTTTIEYPCNVQYRHCAHRSDFA